MSSEREYTHNMCGEGGCPHCHCHGCATVALEERDKARQVARDFFAVLKRIAPLEVHDEYLQTRYGWLREAKEMGT